MAQNSQFTLFLIGPVGQGKSTFCNFLFHEQRFHEKENVAFLTNEKSTIFNTNTSTVEYNGTQITLYDFPGFLDHRFPSEKMYNEIREAGLNVDPDCFGYVINFSKRMSAADFREMQTMINSFGTHVWDHLFAIFTHEDSSTKFFPGQTGREFVEHILNHEDVPDAMVNLMPKINKRYMTLDNKTHGYDEEYWNSVFTELVGLMNEVKELNRGVPFDGKQLGPGIELHRELEKQEKAEEERKNEEFQRNIAKFYSDAQNKLPNPPIPPTATAPTINPIVVKQSTFSRVKLYLKNFYSSHPRFVIVFIFTAPLTLFLCYSLARRRLDSPSFLSVLKWKLLCRIF